jgi:hypothetical protein
VVDGGGSAAVSVPEVVKNDLLLVLDTSASMNNQAGRLGSAGTFLDGLFEAPLGDTRVAITDTDDASGGATSDGLGGSILCDGSAFVALDDAGARAALDCAFTAAWESLDGSGTEQPFGALEGYLADHPGFLRPDAVLHVAYVGDSPDQTAGSSPAAVIASLDALVADGATRDVFVHVVAEAGPGEACDPGSPDADVSEVRDHFGGVGGSICSDASRETALLSIVDRLRRVLERVFVPGCGDDAPLLCLEDGDLCRPFADGAIDQGGCFYGVDPIVDAAGHVVVVATNACTLP